MHLVNHYSALLLWLLLLAGGLSVVLRRGRKALETALLGIFLLVTAAVWFLVRPMPTHGAAPAKLASLVEIQSPFCLACLAQKAGVDRAEQELTGRVFFRRVDIQSSEGRSLAEKYEVDRTPTFIFFDESGEEQWRSIGKLELPRLRASLQTTSPN